MCDFKTHNPLLCPKVRDTGIWVLDNTRPFCVQVIVNWITIKYIQKNVNITVSGNTDTLEMFQYSQKVGRSSTWYLKYAFFFSKKKKKKKKQVETNSFFQNDPKISQK